MHRGVRHGHLTEGERAEIRQQGPEAVHRERFHRSLACGLGLRVPGDLRLLNRGLAQGSRRRPILLLEQQRAMELVQTFPVPTKSAS